MKTSDKFGIASAILAGLSIYGMLVIWLGSIIYMGVIITATLLLILSYGARAAEKRAKKDKEAGQ